MLALIYIQHKLIQKLRLLVDTAEQLLFEALTLKDPSFALETPFWDVVAPGAEAFDAVYAEQATGTWTMKQLGKPRRHSRFCLRGGKNLLT